MNKLLISAMALAASIAGPAIAADMLVKAPPKAVGWELAMRRLSARIFLLVLAVFVFISFAQRAFAQSTQSQSVPVQSTDELSRRLETIEASNAALAKENAALRERVRHAEESAKPRDRMRQLADAGTGPAAQQSSPSISTAALDSASKRKLYNRASPMAVRTPPPVFSWTGFYVGANGGYGWGSVKDTLSMFQMNGVGNTATLGASNFYSADGLIGGIQAGYNWQLQNYLLGVEADIQASGQKDTSVFNTVITTNIAVAGDPTTVTDSAKLDWFGTVRGRLGITSDRWLAYATGGLAYGRVNINGNAQAATSIAGIPNAPLIWNNSTIKVGWTLGAGLENALSSNWSWKIEYLYMNFGNVTANFSGGVFNCYGGPTGVGPCLQVFTPAVGPVTAKFTDSIVRGGLNYKFN